MQIADIVNNLAAEIVQKRVAQLEASIRRWLELKSSKKEFEELDEVIKRPFRENKVLNAVIGDRYQIIGRLQKRTDFDYKLLDISEEDKEAIKVEKEIIVYKIGAI